jgi:hypothetical protein
MAIRQHFHQSPFVYPTSDVVRVHPASDSPAVVPAQASQIRTFGVDDYEIVGVITIHVDSGPPLKLLATVLE